MLINENAEAVTKADYPDSWRQGALKFRVTYQFEPGADADGVTVHIPLQVLNQVTADGFDWQIPGLREEVVTELIRSLPKPVRRHYVPAPNYAKAFLERAVAGPDPLPLVLARELQRMVGVPVSAEDFDLAKVPDHLKITFRVVDERRRKIAEDKDLEALRLRLKPKTREAITKAFERVSDPALASVEQRTGLKDWTVGTLPRTFEARRSGQPVKAYPALVDEGASVAVRLFDTEAEQAEAMWRGTRRLILLNVPVNPAKFAADRLSNQQKLALSRNPHGSVQALFEDCATAAADRLIAAHGGPAWDEAGYRRLYDAVRADLVELTARSVQQVQQVLAAWQSCERRLKDTTSLVLVANLQDVKEQLSALVHAGFVTQAGLKRLPDLLRYLVAVDRRLQQMPGGAQRDGTRMEKVREIQGEYADLLAAQPPGRPLPAAVRDIRWMIEELRVSYFAHALGTAFPVSDKRVFKALDEAWSGLRP
jgi:ATP-dependent helicase HrpA